MPIFTVVCPDNHPTDYLSPKEPRPETCHCGLPVTDALTMPARVGPRGGHEGTAPEPLRGVAAALRTGAAGFVESFWRCPDGHYNPRCDEVKPDAATCEKCGKACTEESPTLGKVDWFEEKCGAKGWYDDAGLGVRFYSGDKERRQRIMDERGVVCVADVGEMNDAFQAKEAAKAKDEDETVAQMFREMMHGQGSQTIRRQLDDGRIDPRMDPRVWMNALGIGDER